LTNIETNDLSYAELELYSRQIVLAEVGYKGQLKLRNARVCVVGLGGLGSPILLQLAAMGIGHLRLVDCDVVELSNLHRQPLYDMGALGYAKVEVAAKKLRELSPRVDVEPLPLALNVDNAEDLVRNVDVVVDGLDSMTPRYAINRACQKLNVPYVFGAAIMMMGSVSTIIPGKTPCLECFQGNLDDETLPKCSVVGVHPSILGIVASVEASETVRIILGKEPLLKGRMLHCDIGRMDFEKIDIQKAENCPVCGSEPRGSPMTLQRKQVVELCGRGGKRVFLVSPRKPLELDMEKLRLSLEHEGYEIKVKGDLGVTFSNPKNSLGSVLRSGIVIVEGLQSEEEAQGFSTRILGNT